MYHGEFGWRIFNIPNTWVIIVPKDIIIINVPCYHVAKNGKEKPETIHFGVVKNVTDDFTLHSSLKMARSSLSKLAITFSCEHKGIKSHGYYVPQ